MLYQIDKKCKSNTIYECDRCKSKIVAINNHAIYVKEAYGHPIKKWDLCERCYKSLERGVKKWKKI